MKCRWLILTWLSFFSTAVHSQVFSRKQIELRVNQTEHRKAENKLTRWTYPDMMACAGAVDAYYYNHELVMIDASYNSESGYTSRVYYFSNNRIIQINYHEQYTEPEEDTSELQDSSVFDAKIITRDTVCRFTLCEPIAFVKKSKDKIITNKVDTTLLNQLKRCAILIQDELQKGNPVIGYETLTLEYNAISCACAQWCEVRENNNAENRSYIYLEPANTAIENADSLWRGDNLPLKIKVKGRFISEKGYPANYQPRKSKPEPARVFRYFEISKF